MNLFPLPLQQFVEGDNWRLIDGIAPLLISQLDVANSLRSAQMSTVNNAFRVTMTSLGVRAHDFPCLSRLCLCWEVYVRAWVCI